MIWARCLARVFSGQFLSRFGAPEMPVEFQDDRAIAPDVGAGSGLAREYLTYEQAAGGVPE